LREHALARQGSRRDVGFPRCRTAHSSSVAHARAAVVRVGLIRDAAHSIAIMHHVWLHGSLEGVPRRHVRVGYRPGGTNSHEYAAPPHVIGRQGAPSEIARRAHAESDPRRRIDIARYPAPSAPDTPDPAAIVKRDPPERIVAHPQPIVIWSELPM